MKAKALNQSKMIMTLVSGAVAGASFACSLLSSAERKTGSFELGFILCAAGAGVLIARYLA